MSKTILRTSSSIGYCTCMCGELHTAGIELEHICSKCGCPSKFIRQPADLQEWDDYIQYGIRYGSK